MASNKAPVKVEIKETRHKGRQVFAVRIEQGRTDTILSQRYTRVTSAKTGARRKLKAYKVGETWFCMQGNTERRLTYSIIYKRAVTKKNK